MSCTGRRGAWSRRTRSGGFEERYTVGLTHQVQDRDSFSYPEFEAVARALPPELPLAAWSPMLTTLGRGQDATELQIGAVAGDYFRTLGVAALLGRIFTADERLGRVPQRVAVISKGLWDRAFAGSDTVIGASIWLGGERYRIIGVAPHGFRGVGLSDEDAWIPYNAPADAVPRRSRYTNAYDVRLRLVVRVPGGMEARATGSAGTALRSAQGPVRDPAATVRLVPITERLDARSRASVHTTMTALFGAVVMLLIVACANVGNLLAMRAVQRRPEIAVRISLGISPARLAAQTVMESLVLAVAAGGVALVVATWTAGALHHALIPGMISDSPALDLRVLAGAAGLTVVAGALTGAIPLLHLWRADLGNALRSVGPFAGQRSARLRQRALLVQTTLSTLLIAAAGFAVQSFRNIAGTDIGYQYDDVIMASVPYETLLDRGGDAEARGIFADARARIARIPGVEAVAMAFPSPFQVLGTVRIFLPGRDSVPTVANTPTGVVAATPDFTRVMGVRVLRGRPFTDRDGRGGEPVAMVSARMAALFWPGQDPIGKCLSVGRRTAPCRRVVGVVEDVHAQAILEGPTLRFYLPLDQAPSVLENPQVLLVRTTPGSASRLSPLLRQALDAAAGGRLTWTVQRFSDLLEPELHPWRLSALLFAGLGALAILVAGVGIYGTVAYATALRTREIGVRRALGAGWQSILRLVVAQALGPVVLGGVLGLAIAVEVGRLASAVLYQVSPTDPLTLAAAALILAAAAFVACIVPAGQAVRVDPCIALAVE